MKHETIANSRSKLLNVFSKYFLIIALVLVSAFFTAMNPRFLSYTNLLDILRTASTIGIMAIGGVMVWSTGEMNFAIGAQVTLSAAIIGKLMSTWPSQMYLVSLLIAFAGLAVSGLLSGLIVTKLRIPAFLATLTMQMLLNGCSRWITGNATMYSKNWGDYYTFVGQTNIFDVIPLPVVVFCIVGIASHIYMEGTRSGRYIFAVGANAVTCKQVGIHVDRVKILAFVLCGVFAGLAGLVMTSIYSDVSMSMGNDFQLPAISATVLSAAFWKTGKYNVPGAFVGAVLMVAIQNGVITIGGTFYHKTIVQGIMLIIAVLVIACLREEGLPKVSFTQE